MSLPRLCPSSVERPTWRFLPDLSTTNQRRHQDLQVLDLPFDRIWTLQIQFIWFNLSPAFSQNINPYPIKMILPDFPATNQRCHQNLQVVVLPFDRIWAQFILFNRSYFFAQNVDSKCKTLLRPSNLSPAFSQNMIPCYQKTCKFTFKNYIVCLKRSYQRWHSSLVILWTN